LAKHQIIDPLTLRGVAIVHVLDLSLRKEDVFDVAFVAVAWQALQRASVQGLKACALLCSRTLPSPVRRAPRPGSKATWVFQLASGALTLSGAAKCGR
jgi:cytochrome c5